MGETSYRTCGECQFYAFWPEDPSYVGICLLLDSVNSTKRDPFKGGVEEDDRCKYELTKDQQIPLNRTEIAQIVMRNPEDFLEKAIVTADDIDLRRVKGEFV